PGPIRGSRSRHPPSDHSGHERHARDASNRKRHPPLPPQLGRTRESCGRLGHRLLRLPHPPRPPPPSEAFRRDRSPAHPHGRPGRGERGGRRAAGRGGHLRDADLGPPVRPRLLPRAAGDRRRTQKLPGRRQGADDRMAPRSKGRGRTQADLTLKITLAGNPGVGKTSLTRRFVTDTFEERYISTLGTKISSKEFAVDDPSRPGSSVTVSAAIWDIM